MQKQSAANTMRVSDDPAPSGGKPAGQETSGIRAWSSTELPPSGAGSAEADASTTSELTGSAFMFASDWLGMVTQATLLNGGLPTVDLASALDGVFAALSGHATDGVVIGLADDIPVWSLSHDDFSNI